MPRAPSNLPDAPKADRLDMIFPQDRKITKITDEEALKLVYHRGSSSRHGRDPVHLILQRLWFTSIAQYVGLQSFESFDLLQDLDPSLVLEDMGYTANHIFRLVMGNVARKTSSAPKWDVIPNSPDQIDQQAAKVGRHILDWIYEEKGIREKQEEIAYWTEICGTCMAYLEWDKSAGKKTRAYVDPYTHEPYAANNLIPREKQLLEQLGAVKDATEGDLKVEVISPFHIALPHKFVSMEKMPWVMILRLVPIDEIWERYPKKAKDIRPDEMFHNEDNLYSERIASLVNRSGFSLPSRGDAEEEAVHTMELWLRPWGRFPNGAKIVATKSRILENIPHPYKEAGLDIDFPVVDFHNVRVPGRFWSMGTVEHLIGPQRDYNRSRTQIIQQRDIVANPQWLAPFQANLKSTRVEYGDLIEYNANAGGRPTLENPPTLSQAHTVTAEWGLRDMQTIAAQSEPSLGQVPQGVRSGVALRALQEKDMAVLGPPVKNIERGSQKIGVMALKLFWKYASVPRAIRIYGDSRMVDVQMFKGSDLAGNTAVRVHPDSMMPKSRAATEQTLMEMMSMGALNPAMSPQDRRIVFEALEIGDVDKIFLEENLDRRRARIENMEFLYPAPGPEASFPDVDEDDDHQVHYEEHVKFKKTDDYERLPFIRKLAFMAHIDKHKMFAATMMAAMHDFQQISAGGGGGGSEPKQPGKASEPARKNPTPGAESKGAAA